MATNTGKTAPKTFSLQSTLPRLPIPSLTETATRYVNSLRPLLSPSELKHSEQLVQDFIRPGGLGETLQQRLEAHDKAEPNSWLERWWLKLAYHSWREPLMINSNWYMIMRDHPETPSELLSGSDRRSGQYTPFQLTRAAGFISNLLTYKDMVDNELIPVSMTKQGPQDMDQYRKLFGITRVPKPECDINVGSHPSHSKHIAVMVKDQIFAVDVYDAHSGERLSLQDMEKQLKAVVESLHSDKLQAPVGLFTAVHRDTWAEMHAHLEKLSAVNRESFSVIEQALFVVSLDDYTLPEGVEYLSKNTFHGMTGHNRWFDKSLDVCIMNDGRTGINGEHSPCDALIPAFVADWVVEHEPARDPPSFKSNPTLRPPRHLEWVVDDKIKTGLKAAEKEIHKAIANSDVRVLHYKGYGTDFIKKTAKTSPDAYMQMALQATYHRIHKSFAPVYETASTRQFLHGRTETCRSLSLECKDFVQAFENKSISNAEKYSLLQKAAAAHVSYLNFASQGRGVDRHLLGLRMCLQGPEETAQAKIFSDPAYAESQHWRLSTSGLFPGDRITGTGFGTVYPDGYGMNYILWTNLIKIGVESKIDAKDTSSTLFVQTLTGVLNDMKDMCMAAAGDASKAQAKL
ncbi:acyltransferase ChoActase/COT/CPT [Phlyctochytrium arcticum]|nr:acyltransferase ChoActase/COT/CPT [Phlyctochytrium arcticum]